MAKVGMSSPWINLYHKIDVMFANDPGVTVEYDEEKTDIKLYVEDNDKAYALSKLLPTKRVFGNVTVTITVIPANNTNESLMELFQKAFEGNPAVERFQTGADPITSDFNYVVFQKKVVQFFDDNLSDPNGYSSTLYQDIAKDIFEDHAGVFFCTDSEESDE